MIIKLQEYTVQQLRELLIAAIQERPDATDLAGLLMQLQVSPEQNRFAVVNALPTRAVDLGDLTLLLARAVEEAMAEGEHPSTDPAVTLIGIVVSFFTNGDRAWTNTDRQRLVDACYKRMQERAQRNYQ